MRGQPTGGARAVGASKYSGSIDWRPCSTASTTDRVYTMSECGRRPSASVSLERLRFSLNPLPEIFDGEPFGPFIHISVINGHALNFVNS